MGAFLRLCLLLTAALAGLALAPGLAREGWMARLPAPERLEGAILARMAQFAYPGWMEAQVASAIAADDPDSLEILIDTARMLDRPVPEAWLSALEDMTTPAAITARWARRGVEGFVSGGGDSVEAMAAGVVSDFTLWGDLRDGSRELGKLAAGEEADELVLMLSGAGVALTAVTVATAGGGAAAKGGLSLLKGAARSGLLSPALRREATATLRAARGGGRVALRPLQEAGERLWRIEQASSTRHAVRVIRHVNGFEDLRHAETIAQTFGKRTGSVFKVLGREAIHVVKATTRLTVAGIAWLTAAAISLIGGFLSFLSAVSLLISMVSGALSLLWRGMQKVASL
ncbi:hypothetical protein [Telmatospirillum sp. J64-1]|uniref:hypothetical protein n=1 Tax=Telmatospirillum sp. J64-1 TaxID=2502183 RepID=UPI00115E85B8|nr:hypothetical protein [Telmatospirillum sp. J64-1]